MHRWIARVGALFLLASLPLVAGAATWPSRPVTIVIGYAPGGPVDFVARAVAKGLGEQFGQPVIVENKPGAGATIAAASVARAQPDGYTMLLMVPGLASAESLYPNRHYKLDEDFAPISLIGTSPTWLLTNRNSPFKTVQDVVNQAAASPGKYSYGQGASGGIAHLTAELMKVRKGLDIKSIGYRGQGPALTDLMAGNVELVFDQLSSSAPLVKSGQLRPLAVTTVNRLPAYPDVPTMQEAGFDDFLIEVWYGLAFPAGTPPDIVRSAQAALAKALAQPDVAAALARADVKASPTSPEEMQALVKKEIVRWRTVIEKNNISLQ